MAASTKIDVGAVERPTEAQRASILPSSVPKNPRRTILRGGIPWTALYCANCGKSGGYVPEASIGEGFQFYLCESPCGEKWSPLVGTMLIPDEVFWEKVKQVQIEEYGRALTAEETAEILKDENSVLSKLARDRRSA